MRTIAEIKEQAATETPLLLFECELSTGAIERWSTHRVEVAGHTYEPRVLRHNLFELRGAAENGIDAIAKISLTLANADSHFSQIERSCGWKGSRITASFVFFDLPGGAAASESVVVFQGTANPPDEITEATFRLTANNSLNFQRVFLPEIRIQRRCPWKFPKTLNQREDAIGGGRNGKYSPFFRCGYSADLPEGTGNYNGTKAFTTCDQSKAQCKQRGMFAEDEAGRPTRRFGGIEFVPPTTMVRTYGERDYHVSSAVENESRYNDVVPLVYGTAWYSPPIVFAKNDGNLTCMEVLLGMGEIESVQKILVNDIEIPAGRAGANMTDTGWFNVVSLGSRSGAFNLDYTDTDGQPLGDCYGSMAVVSVVVPNRINNGRSLPRIDVLVQGLKLPHYDMNGNCTGEFFTNNPAWVLLDVIRRSGWDLNRIDVASFAEIASYCGELIDARDLYGNAILIPRFECNLVIRKRRSAADVIRGIRNGSRLYLTYSSEGRLKLRCENTLALEQAVKPVGSNSTEKLNGGWPAYEFGDGSMGPSGILRKNNGEPSIRVWCRSTAETPNRFTVEFQDALNEYQQDSLSLVDTEDMIRTGQEVSCTLPALGISNFNQAARIVRFNLDKSVQGNTLIEFETSVRGFGIKPGNLIAVTYLKEGFVRQAFRVVRIAPGLNYCTSLITAQIHRDEWYQDSVDLFGGASRYRSVGSGIPRPLGGTITDAEGYAQFEIAETCVQNIDERPEVNVSVSFMVPPVPKTASAGIPMVSLGAQINTTGGTLEGDQTLYYSISAVDPAGAESGLSFVVPAVIPTSTNTNAVTLTGLAFSSGTTAFHVYRGTRPDQLSRIASNLAPQVTFTDSGLPSTLLLPPDENYDHANFYWRFEIQPEYSANLSSSCTIGNTTLQMLPDAYRGMVVRITKGRGAGQERTVTANTSTVLSLGQKWEVQPDSSSYFVVAAAGWHLAAITKASPVGFQLPNRVGATVHITGRSANARNEECAATASPLTRYQIQGAGFSGDLDVPGEPSFGLTPVGGGRVELASIAFDSLVNTRTITAGTLMLHYWPELNSPSKVTLVHSITAEDQVIEVSASGLIVDALFQIEAEVMRVLEVLTEGVRFRVERGVNGSTLAEHPAHAKVYELSSKVFVLPFVREFFGSRASGNYAFPLQLPKARIACAELFMVNAVGKSATGAICVTNSADGGMRTLSGGQFSIQIQDHLAIQTNAAPPLIVQEDLCVRDVFAVVRHAPTGSPIVLQLRDGQTHYSTLTIPEGANMSNSVSGFGLPPLLSGTHINMDILSVGTIEPGRDLTVTIRL